MTFRADSKRCSVLVSKDLSNSKYVVRLDLFSALKPLLRFGQLFGICPYRGLWDNSLDKHAFTVPRWNSKRLLISYFIILLLSVNLLMNFAGMVRKVFFGDPNPIEVAWALFPPMFYATGLHTYLTFCCKAENIQQLFLDWRRSLEEIHVYGPNTKSWILRYTCRVRWLSAIILTSAVLENVVYHTRYDCSQTNCKLGDGTRNFSVLEEYYWREHRENWVGAPYNPLVTVLLFIANKLTVIATNYADIFIISVAGLTGAKFQDFVKAVKTTVQHDDVDWSRIRDDYLKLRSLIEQVSHCLSAMTFTSMALLLELISTQVHLAISTDSEKPFMAKVYSVWSFLHLVFRFVLICTICSKIPEQTRKLQILLYQSSSAKFLSLQVKRMERSLCSPLEITGLNCFRVKKSFILSFVHVVFTCEILFLQTTIGSTAIMCQKSN